MIKGTVLPDLTVKILGIVLAKMMLCTTKFKMAQRFQAVDKAVTFLIEL